jgi:hypothetical protein
MVGEIEVEFTVIGLRCKQCVVETADSADSLAIFKFAQEHNRHTGYTLVGRITSPASLASGQVLDMEWKHAKAD